MDVYNIGPFTLVPGIGLFFFTTVSRSSRIHMRNIVACKGRASAIFSAHHDFATSGLQAAGPRLGDEIHSHRNVPRQSANAGLEKQTWIEDLKRTGRMDSASQLDSQSPAAMQCVIEPESEDVMLVETPDTSNLLPESLVHHRENVRVFRMRLDSPDHNTFTNPAPAPRLHYLTFWKKIGRLAYRKNAADLKESTRLLAAGQAYSRGSGTGCLP
jgi:hypothetical protein